MERASGMQGLHYRIRLRRFPADQQRRYSFWKEYAHVHHAEMVNELSQSHRHLLSFVAPPTFIDPTTLYVRHINRYSTRDGHNYVVERMFSEYDASWLQKQRDCCIDQVSCIKTALGCAQIMASRHALIFIETVVQLSWRRTGERELLGSSVWIKEYEEPKARILSLCIRNANMTYIFSFINRRLLTYRLSYQLSYCAIT